MFTIEAAIKRHAVLIYFALVCVISGGGILVIIGPGGFPLNAEQFASFGPLMYAAILAGPCVSGILVAGIVDGRPGLCELLARLRRWHVSWTWYASPNKPACFARHDVASPRGGRHGEPVATLAPTALQEPWLEAMPPSGKEY